MAPHLLFFAVLTPTPITFTGPTRFRYYQFWLEHTLGYIAIFYMIFVHKMRPTIRSAIRSYIALAVAAVFAYWVNLMIPGANYLYMARPESTPSILDILPPNFALRITIMAAVITLLYGIAYLPWYLKDRRAKNNTLFIRTEDSKIFGALCKCSYPFTIYTPKPQFSHKIGRFTY